MDFFAWLGSNWHLVIISGSTVALAFKAIQFLARLTITINTFFTDLGQAKNTVNLLATNHLPHLQSEMERTNEALADLQISTDGSNEILIGIRENLRAVLDRV